ncbi:hypothetical protein D0T49_03775 [Paludibacter sp. 221]|uniref:hypothetical protein n=1 Tax=Paludibacter sp. 221 TaxID=2302939 RepID=UPI0013D2A6DE|nr:hypothetical protein [Paludibacter sp. 221]NDV46160.1 hypothetical protein [Paludibacter sp. 221]
MKTVVKILLGIAIIFLAYLCIMSIVTPIQFENTRTMREKAVVKNLIDIRKAQLEYRDQYGRFVSDLDSLVDFVRDGKKKIVSKEGALTDAQLEAGLTEAKAVRIVNSGNQREIEKNGLQGFRRDTTVVDVISEIFKGEYTRENIGKMIIIPYSQNVKYGVEVNNGYKNDIGIRIPLFEVTAPYKTYLHDLDRQEMLNLIDKAEQMDKYPGLKVGSVDAPNNNAGNWE